MANIFDGINKFDKEKLIETTAILESINAKNISKIMAQRFGKQIIDTSKGIGKFFGKKDLFKESTVKEISQVIEEEKMKLRNVENREVMKRFLTALAAKVDFNFKGDRAEGLYENLSVKVIYEASLLYETPQYFTPAQRADFVYKRYIENSRSNVYRKEGDKDNLNTGKDLNRELLARLVYSSINYYGRAFTPRFETLPNYIEKKDRDEKILEHEEFVKLYQSTSFYSEKIEKNNILLKEYNEKLEKVDGEMEKERNLIAKFELQLSDIRIKRIQLEIEKDNRDKDLMLINTQLGYGQYEDLKLKYYKVKQEINDLLRDIRELNEDALYRSSCIKKSKSRIDEIKCNSMSLAVDILKINGINDKFQTKYNQEISLLNNIIKDKIKDISLRWIVAYPAFRYSEAFMIQAITLNPVDELPYLERTMSEIYSYKDLTALSGGKKEKESIIKSDFNDRIGKIKYSIKDSRNVKAQFEEVKISDKV